MKLKRNKKRYKTELAKRLKKNKHVLYKLTHFFLLNILPHNIFVLRTVSSDDSVSMENNKTLVCSSWAFVQVCNHNMHLC